MSNYKIKVLVTNDLVTDQRVFRSCSALAKEGYDVEVIGRRLPSSVPYEQELFNAHRLKNYFTKGKWFYLEHNLRLIFYLIFKPFDLILANDVDTALAAHFLHLFKRKPWVVDLHEYFSELPEIQKKPFVKKVWSLVEKKIVPKASLIFTVNAHLADVYGKILSRKVYVIRSVPFRKNDLGISINKRGNKLLYQGSVNIGRGIDLMIRCLLHLPIDWSLIVVGGGDKLTELKNLALQLNVIDRVQFIGRIPFQEVHDITLKAKIGLSLEEDLGGNYRYALPNKMFDYQQAQLPVIISDLPAMKKQLELDGNGKVLETRSPEKLAELVLELDRQLVTFADRSKLAAEINIWEKERNVLIQHISSIFKS